MNKKNPEYIKAHPWEFGVEVLRNIPLSEQDIIKYLGTGTPIYKYNELMLCKDIYELFGNAGYCIILIETKPNFGHWVCLRKNTRYGWTFISFFDSYGGFPDKQKRYIGQTFLHSSNQHYNKLCELLYFASCDEKRRTIVEFSETAFQNINDSNLSTCGHWCCVFIESGLTVDEFREYIKKFDETNKDNLVVRIFFKDRSLNKPKKQKMTQN